MNTRDSSDSYDSSGVYDTAEFADNPEARCPVVLILDTSASMAGPRIERVNQALAKFRDGIREDTLTSLRADVAVIAFNHEARLVRDFTNGATFEPPVLTADGLTNYSRAINLALDRIEARKQSYREGGVAYYRSLAYFLTDSLPTDAPGERAQAAMRLAEAEKNRSVAFFSFIIMNTDRLFDPEDIAKLTGMDIKDVYDFIEFSDHGDSSTIDLYGIAKLTGISHDKLWELGRTPVDYLEQLVPSQRPPVALTDLEQLAGSIEWLSRSVAAISHSQPGEGIRLPPQQFRND